jgi:hypothetical protein
MTASSLPASTPVADAVDIDSPSFVADADDAHDGGEAVDAVWIEPAAALSAAVSGARKIIFPTRLNIELLARSASAQGAMADARARAVRTVEPWIEPGPDGPILVIDPDAGYGAVRELLEPNRP